MKNDKLSETFRAEGNKFYAARHFFEALIKYNESLCCASLESENLGLAFANRSAAYFEVKLYEKSLKNVELARLHKYPVKNLEVLDKREEKCREMMKSRVPLNDPWTFFKLSHETSKRLPFVVNCLELRVNEKFGKHIVTNQNLKVGDVLAIERPFCNVLLSESNFVEVEVSNKFQRCTNCLKDNALDLIPCEKCCDAMFCSPKCRNEASQRFHRYECPIMALMKSGSVHIALRFLFISILAFEGSVENLENFITETDKTVMTPFDFDLSTGDDFIANTKNYLRCLNSLSQSSKMFSVQHHSEILSGHPDLKDVWQSHEKFLRNLLQRFCQINDLYFHGIFSSNLKLPTMKQTLNVFKDYQQPIGSGWFPFCSLINHSCCPNVARIYVEGKVVLVACRPIDKGSQLFDCYKANFNKQPKEDRQARIYKEFNFICDCEACEGNYPTPPMLPYKDLNILKFAKKADDEILNLKPSQAVRKYHQCCQIIEQNRKLFPSIEISLLQKCMTAFLLYQARAPFTFS